MVWYGRDTLCFWVKRGLVPLPLDTSQSLLSPQQEGGWMGAFQAWEKILCIGVILQPHPESESWCWQQSTIKNTQYWNLIWEALFQHFSNTLICFLTTWSSNCYSFFAADVTAVEIADKFIATVCYTKDESEVTSFPLRPGLWDSRCNLLLTVKWGRQQILCAAFHPSLPTAGHG